MTVDDVRELQEAEELARRFLKWNLAAGSELTKETLRRMIEEVSGV